MNQNNHAGKITQSKEDYLKIIMELSNDEDIHSIEIANALGVSKASVSCMLRVLKDEGYVNKERYGTVTLTENGRNIAANVKRRYELLKRLLNDVLGVEATTAAGDACRIEHLISSETTDKIDRQLEKLSKYK
jgi:DtxR family Mn-dependent transcriptional regulator